VSERAGRKNEKSRARPSRSFQLHSHSDDDHAEERRDRGLHEHLRINDIGIVLQSTKEALKGRMRKVKRGGRRGFRGFSSLPGHVFDAQSLRYRCRIDLDKLTLTGPEQSHTVLPKVMMKRTWEEGRKSRQNGRCQRRGLAGGGRVELTPTVPRSSLVSLLPKLKR